MDITPKYIKMCEKAKEIQHQRVTFGNGDYFAFQNGIYLYDANNIHRIFLGYIGEHSGQSYTWLPRQDQLQGMVFKNQGLQTICTRIEEFSKSVIGCPITIDGTMEQLWLAFVMYENYRRWNEEKEEWEDKTMTDKKMTSLEINRQEKPLQQLCMERLKQDARWGEQNHVGECYMRISKELHDAIKLNPLKSYEIAHRAGIHPATLSQIVSGITKIKSNDQRVIAVGRVLGIPPKDCFLEDREGN